MRLIDADALIKQQYEIWGFDPMYYQGLEASKSQYLIEFLERAQTVDAVPVVRGEWMQTHADALLGVRCGWTRIVVLLLQLWREDGKRGK
jgi:hypothetical protein